jgi:predicted nucleic acid-binding Zn ribbon protein
MLLDGSQIRLCVICGADISRSRIDAQTCSKRCNNQKQDRLKQERIIKERPARFCVICGTDISLSHGLATCCPGECQKTFHRQLHHKYSKHNRDTINANQRKRHTKRRDLDALRDRPDRCEVCKTVGPVHFDHDHMLALHKYDEFRGWLCGNCNRAAGSVKDDPVILRALADYLERGGR